MLAAESLGYGVPAPKTLPYAMPSANNPSSDISTNANVRAHVSTRPMSLMVWAPSALQRRLPTPALTASARVTNRMIRSIAIEPKGRTLSGSTPSPLQYNA